jgi:hypothetical protein
MIPKPLSEIEWSDIEALRDSGREEDDTIEFKASFSGGSDFLEFNDAKRTKAIAGIAREAVAFLNGRGGDIVIGVREAANVHPKIEEITPVQNIDKTVDRLAQSLAASIEPAQSMVNIRAIKRLDGDVEGVIVVRCPSSLRAPHRFTPTKECYVRRGRSSVPMPMDEVQVVTLNRAMARAERDDLLDRQFADLSGTQFGLHELSPDRAHFRICFVPDVSGDIELDRAILSAFLGGDPRVRNSQNSMQNDVAFRQLHPAWRPQLRGKVAVGFYESNGNFDYCAKSIKRSMILSCDYAVNSNFHDNGKHNQILVYNWVVGFLANSILSMRDMICRNMAFSRGKVRIAVYFSRGQHLVRGERVWAQTQILPVGEISLPDFEIDGLESFDQIFRQAQIDISGIAGFECAAPYSLPNP